MSHRQVLYVLSIRPAGPNSFENEINLLITKKERSPRAPPRRLFRKMPDYSEKEVKVHWRCPYGSMMMLLPPPSKLTDNLTTCGGIPRSRPPYQDRRMFKGKQTRFSLDTATTIATTAAVGFSSWCWWWQRRGTDGGQDTHRSRGGEVLISWHLWCRRRAKILPS